GGRLRGTSARGHVVTVDPLDPVAVLLRLYQSLAPVAEAALEAGETGAWVFFSPAPAPVALGRPRARAARLLVCSAPPAPAGARQAARRTRSRRRSPARRPARDREASGGRRRQGA